MAKRKIIRLSNRPFTYNPHYYNWGGEFSKALNLKGAFNFKDTFSGANVANMLKGGAASAIGNTLGNIGGNLIGGGLESGVGNTIGSVGSTVGGAVSLVNPVLGGLISAGSGIVSGVTNRMFGSKLNQENIANIEGSNKAMNTVIVDNSSNDSVMNQWANLDFGKAFSQSYIGKDGLFSNKAKNKYKELQKQQEIARNRALTAFSNAANAADTNADINAMANFAAYGGPLNMWGNSAIDYELANKNLDIQTINAMNKGRITSLPNSFGSELNTFADGGKIYIKPENRGKFTALKERTGKSATWFKEHGTPAQKKMATFALNARKWKHADGGPLDSLVADINRRSKADFVQRLLDSNRDYIQDWESDNIATHKLGWATDDKGAIVFPNVQRINGKLYDFTDPKNKRKKWDALDSAIERGDTLRMTPAQAEEFTKTYKKYYPKGKTFKAFGGDLLTHGAEWDNNLRIIGNGGTHEENPMEGVPMGIAPDGVPNLVEEGEVIFDDYVFSNRMTADKNLLESFNLPKSYDGYSFAAIAEKLGKESKERPNDPISKRGLMSSMIKLQLAQETMRQKSKIGQEGRKYANGSKLNLFDNVFNYRPSIDPNIKESVLKDINSRMSTINYGNDDKLDLSWLRYAPVVGSAIGLGQNLLSKPDYSSADAVLEAANQVGNYAPIGYTPIDSYLTYKPFDRNYYINKANAQTGATRRAIMNSTNPSRNAALLAADYNAIGRLGDLARQAEEYDLAQRQAVEQFNRGTKQANAEMGLKAAMANQEATLKARNAKLSGVTQAMNMRDAIDARRAASMSANLTNLFDSLGNIGREEFTKEMIKNNPALLYDWMGRYKGKMSKGGYLTVKKRRK